MKHMLVLAVLAMFGSSPHRDVKRSTEPSVGPPEGSELMCRLVGSDCGHCLSCYYPEYGGSQSHQFGGGLALQDGRRAPIVLVATSTLWRDEFSLDAGGCPEGWWPDGASFVSNPHSWWAPGACYGPHWVCGVH
jgi:hypothetical protein